MNIVYKNSPGHLGLKSKVASLSHAFNTLTREPNWKRESISYKRRL